MARVKSAKSTLDALERTSDAVRVAQRLDKVYESGSIHIMSEGFSSAPVDFISTQSIIIDSLIGRPGIPVGRKTLITGDPSTGKSTIAFHTLAETQRRGGIAVLIDAEYALDPDRAESIGINSEDLIIVEPDHLEAAIESLENLIEEIRNPANGMSDLLFTVVLDSISGIETKSESMDQNTMGSHSRSYSRAMRRITRKLAQQRVAFIDIGQYKDTIDGYGNKGKTFVAEKPAKFHASVHLGVTKKGKVMNSKKKVVGIQSVVKVEKNKIGPPFGEGIIQIGFTNGYNMMDGFMQYGLENGLIIRKGAWYQVVGEESNFQSPNFGKVLENSPTLLAAMIEASGLNYPKDSIMWNPFDRDDELASSDISVEEEDDEED